MSIGPVQNRPASQPSTSGAGVPADSPSARPAASAAPAASQSPVQPQGDAFRTASPAAGRPVGPPAGQGQAGVKTMEMTPGLAARLSGWEGSLARSVVSSMDALDTAAKSLANTEGVNFLSSPQARARLLSGAPEVNKLSEQAGNSSTISCGATLTNVLLSLPKNAQQAKACEQTVRELHDRMPLSLSEQVALKHLGGGKMSPQDVQTVQQVMQRVVSSNEWLDKPGNAAVPTDEHMRSCLYTMLSKFEYASKTNFDDPVTLHHTQTPGGAEHWTCSLQGVHIDSGAPGNTVALHWGTPPQLLDPQNPAVRESVNYTRDPGRVRY